MLDLSKHFLFVFPESTSVAYYRVRTFKYMPNVSWEQRFEHGMIDSFYVQLCPHLYKSGHIAGHVLFIQNTSGNRNITIGTMLCRCLHVGTSVG